MSRSAFTPIKTSGSVPTPATTGAAAGPPSSRPQPGEGEASWGMRLYVLCIFSTAYCLNHWARYLLPYLYGVASSTLSESAAERDAIDVTIPLSETQYGLVCGPGFSLALAAMSLGTGRLVDIYNRRNLVVLSIVTWSAGVFLMIPAKSFWMLFLSRLVIGFGQSFFTGSCFSIISDYFPPDQRALASGVFFLGAYVGIGVGSLSIILALAMGWKGLCWLVVLLGLGLAVVIYITITEPERTVSQVATDSGEVLPLWDAIRDICQSPLLRSMMAGFALRGIALDLAGYYLPTYFRNMYPQDNEAFSIANAVAMSAGAAISCLAMGYIGDAWKKRGNPAAHADIIAIAAAVGACIVPFVLAIHNFDTAVTLWCLHEFIGEGWSSPLASLQQNYLKGRSRGVGYGLFVCVRMATAAVAVVLFGLLIDVAGLSTLGPFLAAGTWAFELATSLCFRLSGRMLVRMDLQTHSAPFAAASQQQRKRGGSGPYQRLANQDLNDDVDAEYGMDEFPTKAYGASAGTGARTGGGGSYQDHPANGAYASSSASSVDAASSMWRENGSAMALTTKPKSSRSKRKSRSKR